MFEKMSKRMNCNNCSHKVICKHKQNYKEFHSKIINVIDNENNFDIFKIDLICNEFDQDKETLR